ncbi:MAG: PKD domain-containing protein [Vicinamibacterales bacterium]
MRNNLLAFILASGLAACGGGSGSPAPSPSPTPTPTPTPNRSPSITSMTVTSFGISELGTFQGSANATDPDGDTLTYQWDIGGIAASGSTWSKLLKGNGTYDVTLTVTDGKGGSATDKRPMTVGCMTGHWVGTQGPSALGQYYFDLTQNGAVVTGTYFDSTYGAGQTDPAEPGRIDVNGNVQMRVKQGPFTDWYFTGTMDTTGRRITGSVRGSGFTGQPFAIQK